MTHLVLFAHFPLHWYKLSNIQRLGSDKYSERILAFPARPQSVHFSGLAEMWKLCSSDMNNERARVPSLDRSSSKEVIRGHREYWTLEQAREYWDRQNMEYRKEEELDVDIPIKG